MLKLLALVLLPFAIACGTTSDAAPPVQKASTADPHTTCVQVMTRARACTDQYIPALVDLRAKYDQPPGVADKIKADRDGIIAQAKEEWAVDSTDANIAQMCTKMVADMSDADRADATAAQSCLADQECAGFTSCVMPHIERRFAK
jgi:hypothetical protein